MEGILFEVIDQHVASYHAAEVLETALINQKGFVTYYLVDSDPDWLGRLGKHRQVFEERLADSRRVIDSEEQAVIIRRIEALYSVMREHLPAAGLVHSAPGPSFRPIMARDPDRLRF